MAIIHHTAEIDPRAELGVGVVIGPNVKIYGDVTIGDYSVIGGRAEHSHAPDPAKGMGVIIYTGARISEFVTIHGAVGKIPTTIGLGAMVFNHSHIGHDCLIGNEAIIGGQVSLAGHVVVCQNAVVSGKSCIHQRIAVGHYAFLGAMSYLTSHLPPGELWVGCPARPAGNNIVGLSRGNMTLPMLNRIYAENWDYFKKHAMGD